MADAPDPSDIELDQLPKESQDSDSVDSESTPHDDDEENRTAPIDLEWKDLNMFIRTSGGPLARLFKRNPPAPGVPDTNWRTILDRLNGKVHGGQVLAIIGPSGAGKTSMLALLGQQLDTGSMFQLLQPAPVVQGDILVNGTPFNRKRAKRVSAFVAQDDILLPFLTVEETLFYSAQLRVAGTYKSRQQLVNSTIEELGLEKCRNTYIGNQVIRGVSGGEKKRTSIGFDLIVNPRLLFLDEPTSGLDSFTSLKLLETVMELAHKGQRTIITTIHQPRSQIFKYFDLLLLLANGKVVYFGPANEAVEYFGRLGYQCPEHENPADYFIDLLTARRLEVGEGQTQDLSARLESFFQSYQQFREQHPELANSTEVDLSKSTGSGAESSAAGTGAEEQSSSGRRLRDTLSSISSAFGARRRKQYVEKAVYTAPLPLQLFWLMHRSFNNVRRNKQFIFSRFFQSLALALLLSLLYFRTSHNQTGVQNLLGLCFFSVVGNAFPEIQAVSVLFPPEREVVRRERRVGMYGISAYYFSKQITDLPFIIFFPIMFTSIMYFIVGFQANAGKFFETMLFLILATVTANSMGMIFASLFSTLGTALVGQLAMVVNMLFAGFLINPKSYPSFMTWIQYLSFLKYAFMGIVQVQFGGLTFYCTSSETTTTSGGQTFCPITNGKQVITEYDANQVDILGCYLILIGFTVFFRVVTYLLLRFVVRK